MKQFNTTIATLSIAAAGVFAVAGTAKADSTHTHTNAHIPHTHTHGSTYYDDPTENGNAIGNAIVLDGLLIGGIALLDALSNAKAETHGYYGYTAPRTVVAPPPKPVLKPYHAPKPHPVAEPKKTNVDYTTNCRDHGHIGISWDGPREFSLRRPNGSTLKTIHAGRPVMKRVANALDFFGLDTTCVIKTVSNNGKVEKTRLFLSNGRLARVANNWSGADRIIRLNPDNLQIEKVRRGEFHVTKPNGKLIETLESRKQARAFIAFLDEKNARKKVVIEDYKDETKFAIYAR